MNNVNFDESGVRVDSDGDTKLQVFIETDRGSYRYGFSLDSIDKHLHSWLFEVVQRQMNEIHKNGVEQGKREVRKLLKAALGGGE